MRRTAMGMAAIVAAQAVLVAPAARADDSGQVSASVTASAACIQVEATSVDFGTQPFSTSTSEETAVGEATPPGGQAEYTLTNCSSGTETIAVSGTDATDGATATWTLDDDDFTSGICSDPEGATDRYRLSALVDHDADGSVTDAGTAGTFLSTSFKPLNGADTNDPLAASATREVGNEITMPCSGSTGLDANMTMTVTYLAVLAS